VGGGVSFREKLVYFRGYVLCDTIDRDKFWNPLRPPTPKLFLDVGLMNLHFAKNVEIADLQKFRGPD
jgi:hypothetical protein